MGKFLLTAVAEAIEKCNTGELIPRQPKEFIILLSQSSVCDIWPSPQSHSNRIAALLFAQPSRMCISLASLSASNISWQRGESEEENREKKEAKGSLTQT